MTERPVLVASLSCPWSHATLLARGILGLEQTAPVHIAGGPRIEGYGLVGDGPLNTAPSASRIAARYRHVHQLYTATDPRYTGRVTVPILWDPVRGKLLLTDSADILNWLDALAGPEGAQLDPAETRGETGHMLDLVRNGLALPVYHAGLARDQDSYDTAAETVFATLDALELLLASRRFLLGSWLSVSDLRLFSVLVRFDAVYGPFFRCTRRRLSDYTALWAYTRDILAWPGVGATVDMRSILEGYYLNDGDTNPHRIVAEAPDMDWAPDGSRDALGPACLWSAATHRPEPLLAQSGPVTEAALGRHPKGM